MLGVEGIQWNEVQTGSQSVPSTRAHKELSVYRQGATCQGGSCYSTPNAHHWAGERYACVYVWMINSLKPGNLQSAVFFLDLKA